MAKHLNLTFFSSDIWRLKYVTSRPRTKVENTAFWHYWKSKLLQREKIWAWESSHGLAGGSFDVNEPHLINSFSPTSPKFDRNWDSRVQEKFLLTTLADEPLPQLAGRGAASNSLLPMIPACSWLVFCVWQCTLCFDSSCLPLGLMAF